MFHVVRDVVSDIGVFESGIRPTLEIKFFCVVLVEEIASLITDNN